MKKLSILSYVFSFLALIPAKAAAMCPVCTVGVVAGLGLSRWLGIDDTISGLWIGGLLLSISLWTINYFRTKKILFPGMPVVTTLLYYIIVLVPLYYKDIIGHPLNVFWGIDRLILGALFGSVFFAIGAITYGFLKKRNGKTPFPFAKVAFPITPLIVLSIIFYFLTK